jgi:GT2 family glycosyltransferase
VIYTNKTTIQEDIMSKFKHTIVIPTCAEYDVLMDSVPRFFLNAREDSLFVFSFNPFSVPDAKKVEEMIAFWYSQLEQPKFQYEVVWSLQPIGFANAVNKGIAYARDTYGHSEYTTIANDDLIVTEGWLEELEKGLNSKGFSTLARQLSTDEIVSIEDFNGKLGIIGPISDGVFNDQRVTSKHIQELGIDAFAASVKVQNAGKIFHTQFLSGFCFCLTKECLEDLSDESFSYGGLLDDRFKVGGFEDDDLMVRASNKGWKPVVSQSCFVGHKLSQTLNRRFAESHSGLANYITYLMKWEEETQKKDKLVVGAYRVGMKCVNDLNQFRLSIMRNTDIIDGFSVLLTTNPKFIAESYDKVAINMIPKCDQEYIAKCKELPDALEECSDELIAITSDWIDSVLKLKNQQRQTNQTFIYNVDVWTGSYNERDERNRTHELAEELEADWIMSIDCDEMFEDRMTREHLQRIISHPNPLRTQFSTSFINHWESMKLIRTDKHYGKMTGYRLWKSTKNAHRIFAGNEIGFHCGNSPETGSYGRIPAAIRMRHLSHVRQIDRDMKYKFYQEVDQDKKEHLIGSSDYSHINQTNDIEVGIYRPNNGLGFFMLCYEKENWISIINWLDQMYAVADKIALVWTGEWNKEDFGWVDNPELKNMSKEEFEDKYKTGPRWELAQGSRLFKVQWIYEKLKEETGLARCRNAGINYLYHTNTDKNLGWAMFIDPDEIVQNSKLFGIEILNAITSNDAHGFMFNFSNPVNDGSGRSGGSQSIRIIKLDDKIRMTGSVHETFEASLHLLKDSGVNVKIKNFPVKMINTGLSKTPEIMAEKLTKYRDYLLKQLKENPYNTGAWTSLALQFLNDNRHTEAEQCFDNAVACAGSAYLPFKEYGLHCLRKARALLIESQRRSNSLVPFTKRADLFIQTINSWQLDLPKINTGAISVSDSTVIPQMPTPEEFVAMLTEKAQNEIQDESSTNEKTEINIGED